MIGNNYDFCTSALKVLDKCTLLMREYPDFLRKIKNMDKN
jgi:hypothetical protein